MNQRARNEGSGSERVELGILDRPHRGSAVPVTLATEEEEAAQPPPAALPAAQAHMHPVCFTGPRGPLRRNRRGKLLGCLGTGPVGGCEGEVIGGQRES
jgi:hypothetical protein